MNRWVRSALGLAAAGTVGLGLYATSLPESHVATVSCVVRADPEEVRARVMDWRHAAEWKPDVERVVDLGVVEGQQRFRECTWECLDIAIESVQPYRTRIVDHPDFGGTWTWEFSKSADGTRVVLTERGEVPNPVFRFFMVHVFGEDANIRATTEALQRSFG